MKEISIYHIPDGVKLDWKAIHAEWEAFNAMLDSPEMKKAVKNVLSQGQQRQSEMLDFVRKLPEV